MIPSRRATAVLELASLLAPTLRAQVLELRLRDQSTRAPLAGAIVRLIGNGGPVGQGLTDERGRRPSTGPARVPAEFLDDSCAAIAIWTR